MCSLDRTRRVLQGKRMRKLESICGRIAQDFTKFDVFLKGFLAVCADFRELEMFGVKAE